MAEAKKKVSKKKPIKKPSVPKEVKPEKKVQIPKEIESTIAYYKKNNKPTEHLSEFWINEETGKWFWEKEGIEKDKTLSKEDKKKFINIKL